MHDYDLSLSTSQTTTLAYTMSQVTIIVTAAVGSLFVIGGTLTIGGLAACTLLSGRVLQPINALVNILARMKTIAIAREDLRKVLLIPEESSENLPVRPPFKGKVTFENMSFRYSEDQPWIFKNATFAINPRETIGITGQGYCGKSTLLYLLMGVLKPETGKILLDDEDIENYQLASVRQQIAYLPQKPILFKGSILENITMFEVKKYAEEAKRIAMHVGLNEIVSQLPKGYDTPVAESTADGLPRGVKQRIAISRALLHKPSLILFDEANTAIDMEGDRILKELVDKLHGRFTVLLVSHRPSFLKMADRVIEIQHQKFGLMENVPTEKA